MECIPNMHFYNMKIYLQLIGRRDRKCSGHGAIRDKLQFFASTWFKNPPKSMGTHLFASEFLTEFDCSDFFAMFKTLNSTRL